MKVTLPLHKAAQWSRNCTHWFVSLSRGKQGVTAKQIPANIQGQAPASGRRYDLAAILTLFSNIVTPLVAVVAVYLSYCALRQTIRQADDTHKTLLSSERPWISIKVVNGGRLTQDGVTFDDDGLHVKFPIVLHNVGHSPGLRIRVKISMLLSQTSNIDEQQHAICKKPWSDNLTFAMFPDDTVTEAYGLLVDRTSVLGDIKNSDRPGFVGPLIVTGCVKYQSDFIEGEGETDFAFTVGEYNQDGFSLIGFDGDKLRPAAWLVQPYPVGRSNYAK